MTTYTGTHQGFECFGHRYGTYAVRDGEAPGKPAGPNYAHVEVDEDGDISSAIADYLYYEEMPEADLIDEAGLGVPLAVAELARRHPQKGIAA